LDRWSDVHYRWSGALFCPISRPPCSAAAGAAEEELRLEGLSHSFLVIFSDFRLLSGLQEDDNLAMSMACQVGKKKKLLLLVALLDW